MSKKRAFLGLILGFLTVVLISVAIPFLYMKITERPEENEKHYTVTFVHVFKDMTPSSYWGYLSEDPARRLLFEEVLYAVKTTTKRVVESWEKQYVKKGGYAKCPNPEDFIYKANGEEDEDGEISCYFAFKGFYTDISCCERFDFDKPITKDTVIYVRFETDFSA